MSLGVGRGQVSGGKGIVLRGWKDGLTTANNGASSQSVKINPGQCDDSTHAVYLSSTANSFKTLASTWAAGAGSAGTPKGGLDTGSVAASTWYHLYAIGGAAGVDFIFSTAAPGTGPAMPTGYTSFRRIWSVLTDGSKNVTAYFQDQNYCIWIAPPNDVNTTLGVTETLYAISIPPGVRSDARIDVLVTNAAGPTCFMAIRPPDGPTGAIGSSEASIIVVTAGQFVSTNMTVRSNASQQVGAISNTANTTLLITTLGYYDFCGANS